MKNVYTTAWIISLTIAAGLAVCMSGCGGEVEITAGEDFPVVAKAQAGGMEVYLSEVRRMGKKIYLVFRYLEQKETLHKTSIICAEITGGMDSEFEKIEKDGWVELRCKTDYPIEAKELGFILRMCEEPSCAKADIVLPVEVPGKGKVEKSGLSQMHGGVKFTLVSVAHLESDPWPKTDAEMENAKGRAVTYGEKHIVVNPGEESALVVVSRAEFGREMPLLPRGYSEWDQVIVTDKAGKDLGGAISTSDAKGSRYFAHVWVGKNAAPGKIKACFFSAVTLAGLRREFVFSGLSNPHE